MNKKLSRFFLIVAFVPCLAIAGGATARDPAMTRAQREGAVERAQERLVGPANVEHMRELERFDPHPPPTPVERGDPPEREPVDRD